MDLTWVSDLTGWALSALHCATGLCVEVSSTSDGGLTWHVASTPAVRVQDGSVDCATVACVSHLRFATTTVGYLYGPALLVTTDGGRSWAAQQSLPVEAMEPTHAGVYRVVYDHGGCPGPCTRRLDVAPAGSGSWRTVTTIPHQDVPSRQDTAQLITSGDANVYIPVYGDVAAGAGTQQAVVFRSTDSGRTWRRLDDPCGGPAAYPDVAVSFAAATGQFIAALCVSRSGGGDAVVTSTSAGDTWGPPHPVPGSGLQIIAAASATHLVVANASTRGSGPVTYTLHASTDGGQQWSTPVTDPEVLDQAAPGSAFLGFEDALVGRWVGYEGAIWTTRDGGTHWLRTPFQ